MVNVQQLIREREQKFVEARTKIEIEVNAFFESLKGIKSELSSIDCTVTGETAKEVLPALWVEPYDDEQYKKELAALKRYITAIISYADTVNEEALKCLQM